MTEFRETTPTPEQVIITDLVVALMAQIPASRNPHNLCWCETSRDLTLYGHEARCLRARAAITATGAVPDGFF